MVLALAGVYAGIIAITPVREFFEIDLISSVQWFLSLLAAAIGLTIASVIWRLPQIEALEVPGEAAPVVPPSPMEAGEPGPAGAKTNA